MGFINDDYDRGVTTMSDANEQPIITITDDCDNPLELVSTPRLHQQIQDAIHATIVSWQESDNWWLLDSRDTAQADESQDRFVDECLGRLKGIEQLLPRD